MTQAGIAELFQTTKQNVSLHLKNAFAEGEIQESAVVKEDLTTAADGKANRTKLYRLEAIPVGYRVRSARCVHSRQRATTALQEYLVTDQAVVPLFYEGRHVEQRVDAVAIDSWFERVLEGLSKKKSRSLPLTSPALLPNHRIDRPPPIAVSTQASASIRQPA